jgi:hypothetical protein
MVSEGDKKNTGSSLSSPKPAAENQPWTREAAKAKLAEERHRFKIQRADWSEPKGDFDHLPPEERPFSIEPFKHERSRVPFLMTDEDRKRRQIWVESQAVANHEPVRVPELETMIYNPIRRLYRVPTDRLFQALTPVLGGPNRMPFFRMLLPKLFLGWLGGCTLWYHLQYNRKNWEDLKGFTVIVGRGVYMPVS